MDRRPSCNTQHEARQCSRRVRHLRTTTGTTTYTVTVTYKGSWAVAGSAVGPVCAIFGSSYHPRLWEGIHQNSTPPHCARAGRSQSQASGTPARLVQGKDKVDALLARPLLLGPQLAPMCAHLHWTAPPPPPRGPPVPSRDCRNSTLSTTTISGTRCPPAIASPPPPLPQSPPPPPPPPHTKSPRYSLRSLLPLCARIY